MTTSDRIDARGLNLLRACSDNGYATAQLSRDDKLLREISPDLGEHPGPSTFAAATWEPVELGSSARDRFLGE